MLHSSIVLFFKFSVPVYLQKQYCAFKSGYPAVSLSGTVQLQVQPKYINAVTNVCFHSLGPYTRNSAGIMERTEVIKPQTLDDLIKILHKIFESDKVNIEEVQDIMEAYESNPQEWSKFAKFDQHRQVIIYQF